MSYFAHGGTRRIMWFLLLALLAGCAQLPEPSTRATQAAQMAAAAGWQPQRLVTDDFVLQAFLPARPPPADTLTVYIEGDGLAWVDSSTPSLDPTPLQPLALQLALRDGQAAAYLARPCQYTMDSDPHCRQAYWTSHRFAPEVIRAGNQALDALKQSFAARRLILVGYSGGGAVATLLAARRHDVLRLITIAAPLDHQAWTARDQLTPLAASLNPADDWAALQSLPQRHYAGGRDQVVGADIARAYAARFPLSRRPPVVVIDDFDHHCCWLARWPALKTAPD